MQFCLCKSSNTRSQRAYCLLLIVLLASFPFTWAFAETQHSYQGQLNLWFRVPQKDPQSGENGIRYIPGIHTRVTLEDGMEIDGEASINFYLTSSRNSEKSWQESVKAHRLWGRIFSEDLEVRIGLQKINWGPGKTLRALQWFDQIDPTDHSGFTEGVKALLLRRYFEDNANLWGWILYGNQEAMGISPYITLKNQPEFGGRFQIPVVKGEAGLSFNHRRIDASLRTKDLQQEKKTENRIGFDAQWDLGLGLWFEYTLVEIEKAAPLPQQQRLGVLGIDYTFDVGNGLYTALEAMQIQDISSSPNFATPTRWTTALTQNYPLNLLDQVGLIALWNVEQKTGKMHAKWQRVQDDLIWNVALFYNVTRGKASSNDSGTSSPWTVSDRGLQVFVQYNH